MQILLLSSVFLAIIKQWLRLYESIFQITYVNVILTKYIDSVSPNNIFCQLHVEPMTKHNQWFPMRFYYGSDVRSRKPSAFRWDNGPAGRISYLAPAYGPFYFSRRVWRRRSTLEWHRVAHSGFGGAAYGYVRRSNLKRKSTITLFFEKKIYNFSITFD